MRILIADDDATSRIMLKAIIAKLGHECFTAEDGSDAWELIASGGIDVLLTDWMMPGLDGPDLCRRVREDLSGHYVYIVLVTGLGQPAEVLEGMSAGADDYLVKPVDSLAVQARLVAAARITGLHHQLAEARAQLEQVNSDLLGRSLTDALTGLGNRRQMDDDLERTHARAVRAERRYAVAIFDVDHFKLYNDHYGHQEGDAALRNVAQCLERNTRSGETVYRYGGEEFLLILHDCSAQGAMAAGERLVRAVAAWGLPHEARPTEPPLLTVSGGIAAWEPGSATSIKELLAAADEALFEAKSAGRNRIHAPRQSSAVLTDLA